MCCWIWDKGNPTEARGIPKVRELTVMWDRAKSNWVKHISQDPTHNSSLASIFCFYPQHLYHVTDLPLFNWRCLKPNSPQISHVHLFPSLRMEISTEPSNKKITVQTEMLKLLKAMKSQHFFLFPVVHGPTCWLTPQHLPSKGCVLICMDFSQKQTDKNATPHKFISSGAASCRELSANQSLN